MPPHRRGGVTGLRLEHPGPSRAGRFDEERALIVRRIFTEYASGRAQASIATLLNEEGVTPPRGNGRRARPGWVASGVRAILLNSKYVGRWTFNAREYLKRPGTGKRTSRKRPTAEVLVHEHADRCIVSPELWAAAEARFEMNRVRYGIEKHVSNRSSLGRAGKPSAYLLSGLLVCGVCGAPMTISGGAKDRRYYYCDDNRKRGTCANALSVREPLARACILAGLRETVGSSVVVAYTRKRIAARLGEIARGASADIREVRAKLSKAEDRIAKLTDAVARGVALDSLLGRLASEDGEAKALRLRLAEAEAAERAPIKLPSPDEVLEAVLDLDARLTLDVEAGRETIRRPLRGGVICLRPGADGVYVAEADVLPLGLFLAHDRPARTATPTSGDRDGRYTTVDCGGVQSTVARRCLPLEIVLPASA